MYVTHKQLSNGYLVAGKDSKYIVWFDDDKARWSISDADHREIGGEVDFDHDEVEAMEMAIDMIKNSENLESKDVVVREVNIFAEIWNADGLHQIELTYS